MSRKRRVPIVVAYVLSLLVTIALLVVWVVYVVRSVEHVREAAGKMGVASEHTHWVVLAVGCGLFFLLIAGLTWQLAQALAARSYSAKQEEFVSNVTHELKSPLAAIKLHTQTLQEEDISAPIRQRSLQVVLQQVDRMSRLVDDILESSRLLARKQPLSLVPIDIGAFLRGYIPDAALRAEAQGVRLSWHIETHSTVLADENALDRILTNLLDNAVRFSHKGGEVRCGAVEADGVVRIEVEDDGIGIPRKQLSKVFDRFYQVDHPQTGRRHGTGLGLSIVAGLVQEMKGRVRAYSQEARPGSRFVVELPTSSLPPRLPAAVDGADAPSDGSLQRRNA